MRQYAQTFVACFSRPRFQHFVIVLVGLLLCQIKRTLIGPLGCLASRSSLASLSRFLSEAPWRSSEVARAWRSSEVARAWRTRFDLALAQTVGQCHADNRTAQPKQAGRPKASVVTGFLIGDDSTCYKMRGKKMEGISYHYSTTASATVKVHSLVQSLYVLLGRRCPMEACIREFEPLADTATHVLLDAWYSAKWIWQAARECGFAITTGLKGNRLMRIRDKGARGAWP